MKRQSIIFILLLLQVLLICNGCGGSAAPAAESPSAAAREAADAAEEAAVEEAAPAEAAVPAEASIVEEEIIADQKAANSLADVEDVIGIFEGLEDNHTALFSFDDAETVFYFEDPAVQAVLFEAVLDSPYTLSYHFDEELGLNVIFEISE